MSSVTHHFIKIYSRGVSPNLKEFENISPKKFMYYLMQPGSMKDKYLGACLDSSRLVAQNILNS